MVKSLQSYIKNNREVNTIVVCYSEGNIFDRYDNKRLYELIERKVIREFEETELEGVEPRELESFEIEAITYNEDDEVVVTYSNGANIVLAQSLFLEDLVAEVVEEFVREYD